MLFRPRRGCLALLSLTLAVASLAAPAAGAESVVLGQLGSAGAWHHGVGPGTSRAAFGLEFRPATRWNYVQPLAGVLVTSSGAAYGYAGVRHDFTWGAWTVVPHFSVGAYHRGAGPDLGGTLEFQTGADLLYRWSRDVRVGITARHISNGGLHDRNPGTEAVMLMVAVPLR